MIEKNLVDSILILSKQAEISQVKTAYPKIELSAEQNTKLVRSLYEIGKGISPMNKMANKYGEVLDQMGVLNYMVEPSLQSEVPD